MYAIILSGGKQLKVEVGQKIFVEKLDAEVGSTYTFKDVLLTNFIVILNKHAIISIITPILFQYLANIKASPFSNSYFYYTIFCLFVNIFTLSYI